MRYLWLALGVSLLAPSAFADNYNHNGCAIKRQELNRQLSYARQHNNVNRIRGLEQALDRLDLRCGNAASDNHRSERNRSRDYQDKIDELHSEILERRSELREAERDGRPDKIEKRRQKLAEVQDELSDYLELQRRNDR